MQSYIIHIMNIIHFVSTGMNGVQCVLEMYHDLITQTNFCRGIWQPNICSMNIKALWFAT